MAKQVRSVTIFVFRKLLWRQLLRTFIDLRRGKCRPRIRFSTGIGRFDGRRAGFCDRN